MLFYHSYTNSFVGSFVDEDKGAGDTVGAIRVGEERFSSADGDTGNVVAREMQKGEGAEVTLPGIGKISVKQSPARIGRNPATGAEISIPAKNKPHFSAAKALKEAAMSN